MDQDQDHWASQDNNDDSQEPQECYPYQVGKDVAFKIQQKMGLTMVDKSVIEIGNMKKSVPVDPSCHPRPQEPECILPRDAMT